MGRRQFSSPKLHFFGSFYLSCPNPSFLRCFVTPALSLIPLTPTYPLTRHTNIAKRVVCVSPPCTKTLAEATEIAVDCEQKDNSHCCCVGVTQLSFIVPTLCDSLGKTGLREKPLQSAETSGCLIVCPQTCVSLLISPTRSFEPTLVSHTATAGSL